MKVNIIPTDEFIEKLGYCSRWYEKLKGGNFVIDNRKSFLRYQTGNFREWIRHELECRRSSNTSAWIELRDLFEALPGIHKLEFNGIDTRLFKDMDELLTTLEGIFKEVESRSGKHIESYDYPEPPPPLKRKLSANLLL